MIYFANYRNSSTTLMPQLPEAFRSNNKFELLQRIRNTAIKTNLGNRCAFGVLDSDGEVVFYGRCFNGVTYYEVYNYKNKNN